MSTQIVDDEHIRVLMWAGLRPHPDGPLTWQVGQAGGRHSHHSLVAESAAQVGAMLHDQNVRANEGSYDEDEGEDDEEGSGDVDVDVDVDVDEPYVHAAPQHTSWTPLGLYKAIEFYTYQSFHDEDHDEATSVEALQFCGALIRRIGPDLPDWGDRPSPINSCRRRSGRRARGGSATKRRLPDLGQVKPDLPLPTVESSSATGNAHLAIVLSLPI